MATPRGELSCRHSGRLLLWSLAGAAAWMATARALHRLKRSPEAESPPEPDLPIQARGAVMLTLTASLLIWLRFVYRAYEPVFGGRPVPTVPWLLIHLLFVFSTAGALGAWWRLRRTEGEAGALFAALFMALSPLGFHVSIPVVAAFGALALCWGPAPMVTPRATPAFWWKVLLPVTTVALALFATGTLGWAGNRLQEQIRCAAPGLTGWLAAAGLAGAAATRARRRPWCRSATALCAWGLVLGGGRGEAGFAGAVLIMPLLAGLIAAGISRLLHVPMLRREAFARNVILMGLTGILLGLTRDGLDRGIRSPLAPPLAPGTPPELPSGPGEVEM